MKAGGNKQFIIQWWKKMTWYQSTHWGFCQSKRL